MPEFTTSDFHGLVQKQILNAVFETLSADKMDWELIAPFLEVARRICASEFDDSSKIRLHTVRAEGEAWVEAEEAYLGIAVSDRDSGKEWLSRTAWISDIAKADDDPAQARQIVAALERSIERIKLWLAEREKEGPAASI